MPHRTSRSHATQGYPKQPKHPRTLETTTVLRYYKALGTAAFEALCMLPTSFIVFMLLWEFTVGWVPSVTFVASVIASIWWFLRGRRKALRRHRGQDAQDL